MARSTATFDASETFKAADTPVKMEKMLKPNTATARMRPSKVPRQQPVGTNHFQLRLHHPGAGCPCIGVSMGAFLSLRARWRRAFSGVPLRFCIVLTEAAG